MFRRLTGWLTDERVEVREAVGEAGVAKEELLRSYPSLTGESMQAVLAYAAELARERVVGLTA